MKKNKNIGLYIHVPFCVQKCSYCDFYSVANHGIVDAYVDALIKNVMALEVVLCDRTVDTVFFGGGTPSLLGARGFFKIVQTVFNSLNIDVNCEFSVEVNPATVDTDLARAFYELHVNRVSVGLQSSDDNELKALSRIHSFDDFVRTFNLISEKVTDNISVDVMYGIPLQSLNSLKKTLSDVTSLSPLHISAYGLKVEANTAFGRMGDKLILPSDDDQVIMYKTVCEQLLDKGNNRYEISNFSMTGMECRHNLKYWNREEYIGIGPSAYSFFEGFRFSNTRSVSDYIKHFNGQNINIIDEKRYLSDTDVYNEKVMLGLRLEQGIVPDEETLKKARIYIDSGFMRFNGNRLSFTTEGFLVSNYILSELIE